MSRQFRYCIPDSRGSSQTTVYFDLGPTSDVSLVQSFDFRHDFRQKLYPYNSVVKLDVIKLEAYLKRTFSIQHRRAAKVLIEIVKITAGAPGVASTLRAALCQLVAVQWPRDAITMSCLRALQDADDGWTVGFDSTMDEIVDTLDRNVDTPEFRWAVAIVKQWRNPTFIDRIPSYTPISPSMWSADYLSAQTGWLRGRGSVWLI